MLCVMHKRFKMTTFVEKNIGFILERIISLLSGITIEKAQVYSNALKSSYISWYHDTFGMMHRYSCTLYRPISNGYITHHANHHIHDSEYHIMGLILNFSKSVLPTKIELLKFKTHSHNQFRLLYHVALVLPAYCIFKYPVANYKLRHPI